MSSKSRARKPVDARLTWLKEHGLGTTALNTVMVYGTGTLPSDPTRNFAPLTVAAG